jgi:tRNA pseudouridine38-40 synthase
MRDVRSSILAIAVSPEATDEAAKVRWRLDIAYDGTNFSGWAVQEGRRTVQGELETWLARILRLAEHPRLVCAGRTDAGVHARGQVAHVDLDAATLDDGGGTALTRRLNGVLGGDCVVRRISIAPSGFDARFGAIWRRYVYRISDASEPPDPLYRYQIAQLPAEVDLARFNEEAATLLGLKDFGAFCRGREGASTIRTLLELSSRRVTSGPMAGVIECTVRADAFCHSMVRSLVGALVAVATGRRDHEWLAEVMERGVRDSTIVVLPAHGLTLEEVGYPADHELVARAREARAVRQMSRS